MKIVCWLVPTLLLLMAVGCSKSDVEESSVTPVEAGPTLAHETPGSVARPTEDRDSFRPAPPVVNAPAAVLPVKVDSAPEVVVTEFLKAMKSGNEGVTAGLLTATAREETAKHQLAVQPPGSPSASYQVSAGEVSEVDPTLAQVGCLWIEKDEAGEERSEQVVWVLRKHTEGWRVCGMATQMPTRPEPVFFDFEDPAEMTALMETIGLEMQASASAELSPEDDTLREARNPDSEPNSLRQE